MKFKKSEKDLLEFSKDKNCIIVGPSATMSGSGMGAFIDSFDVVIRLNNSYRKLKGFESDMGSKTDVLYHCLGVRDITNPYFKEWDKFKYVVFAAKVRTYKQKQKHHKTIPCSNILEPSKDFVNGVFEESGLHILTGTYSILHSLTMNYKEVHAVGLTFFQGGDTYIPCYYKRTKKEIDKDMNYCHHEHDKEFEFFSKKIKQYNDFFPHGVLKSLLGA